MRDVNIENLKDEQKNFLKDNEEFPMKNKNLFPILTIVLLVMSIFSGCIDSFLEFPITYETHPTKISYTISYGYNVTCKGTEKYMIKYNCDLPEVLKGIPNYQPLYNHDFEIITIANNNFFSWNISGDDETTFEIGLTANIVTESFIVSDLNGADAFTVQEISTLYPDIANKYLLEQSNGTEILIDPDSENINKIAQNVVDDAGTFNSFILAKELFLWLKENTEYKIHKRDGSVQPAAETLLKKSGDCDDLSFLYISLCRAVGIPARFIRGYLLSEEESGNILSTPHAWTEVFVGGTIGNMGWIPVECACVCDDFNIDVNQNFGVENAFHLRLFVDDGSNESLNVSLSGITYVTYGFDRTVDLVSINEVLDYVVIESKKLVVTKDNQRSYQL
jgi:transglutaminase-like putative cysteine protease